MRVKAIRNMFVNCPPAIAAIGSPESETHLLLGEEYEVFALSVFQGVVFFQVVVDADHITWLPAWLFKLCDASVPSDWICFLSEGDLQIVFGPTFLAADMPSYNRMVELEPESVTAFWQRVDAISRVKK